MSWRLRPAVVLASAAGFLGILPRTPLGQEDEARIAAVAQEMVLRGDWGTPRLAGVPYAAYPPLAYWLMAVSGVLLGFHEFSMRLPNALAGIGLVGLVGSIGRRIGWGGVAGGAILATLPGFFSQATSARADVLTAFFSALAVDRFLAFRESRHTRDAVVLYVSLALGVMAKGPIALVVAGLWGAGLAIGLKDLRSLWALRPARGFAAVVAVVGPWYLWVAHTAGPNFLRENLLLENVSAFTTGFQQGRPVYFYLGVLPLSAAPWIALLALAPGARREHGFLPAALPVLFVFLFLTASSAKRPGYLAYLFPALAVFLGGLLERGIRKDGRGIRRIVGFWVVALLGVAGALLGVPEKLWTDRVRPVQDLFPCLAAASAGAAGILGAALRFGGARMAVGTLEVFLGAGLFAYGFFAAPRLEAAGFRMRDFAGRVRAGLSEDAPLYVVGPELLEGSLYFYLHWALDPGEGRPGLYVCTERQKERLQAEGRRVRVLDEVRDSRGRATFWMEVGS